MKKTTAAPVVFEPDYIDEYQSTLGPDDEFLYNIKLASGEHKLVKVNDCSVFKLMGPKKLYNGSRILPSNVEMYCEFSHGYAWSLLSTFEQPRGSDMTDIATTEYHRFIMRKKVPLSWINGLSKPPLSAAPAQDGYFNVRSHDWGKVLIVGQKYKLRQQFFKTKKRSLIFDVAYTFTYNGVLHQDDVKSSADYKNDRAWVLTDREVLQDKTGIDWDVQDETVRFWLPFSNDVIGRVYTGCAGFELSSLGCDKSIELRRRQGSAGIIGSTADEHDPAASFAPHFDALYVQRDIVYVHQANHVYGITGGKGGPIFLSYWIAPINE